MTFRVVHKLSCPKCSWDFGQLYPPGQGNLHSIGPPFRTCPQCKGDLIIPGHLDGRCDEWEHKGAEKRADVIAFYERSAPEGSGCAPVFGGCAFAVTFLAVIGVAIGMGAKGILDDTPLLAKAAGGGALAGAALYFWSAAADRKKARKGRDRDLTDLIGAIEGSRARMADPAYRRKVHDMVAGPLGAYQDREPPDVAPGLARLKKLAGR